MLYGQMFGPRTLKYGVMLLTGLWVGSLALADTSPAWAQSNKSAKGSRTAPTAAEKALRKRVNTGAVTLITGGVDGAPNTYQQLASDLAMVLDERSELRILPIMGYGSLQTIEDMLYLKGIDFGMVHSDVMRHMEQLKLATSAKRKLRYVTKLFDQSMHVLANRKTTDIKQLNGKMVILGRPRTGDGMSTLTLISDLGLKIDPVHVNFDEGVEKVRKGEAAAMIVVSRKPSQELLKIGDTSDLHLLPVPMTKKVLKAYEPETLTNADYPGLIPEGKDVVTASMSSILAVYNWPTGSPRYFNVMKFIKSLGDRMDELAEASRKDIWTELDLTGDVKGWERYEPATVLAEDAASARAAANVTVSKTAADADPEFALFADYVRKTTGKDLSEEELKALYQKYKAWDDKQDAPAQTGAVQQ